MIDASPEVLGNKLVYKMELAIMRRDCFKNLLRRPKPPVPVMGRDFMRTWEMIKDN